MVFASDITIENQTSQPKKMYTGNDFFCDAFMSSQVQVENSWILSVFKLALP